METNQLQRILFFVLFAFLNPATSAPATPDIVHLQVITFTWEGHNSVIADRSFSICATPGKLFTVNWGDGEATSHTGTGSEVVITHHYANALGTYIVEITNNTDACRFTALNVGYYQAYAPAAQSVSILDISTATDLQRLDCANNHITALDVQAHTSLLRLICSNNAVSSLNLAHNTALTFLSCNGNQLTALDLTQNTALDSLDCSANQLTVLDLTHNTALTKLACAGNHLSSLDLSQNTAIDYVDCSANHLAELDIRANGDLQYLDCSNNAIRMTDLYAISRQIYSAKLGTQTMPDTIEVRIDTPITVDSLFNGNGTTIKAYRMSGATPLPANEAYTIDGGAIIFTTPHSPYRVEVLPAISAFPTYPANVVTFYRVHPRNAAAPSLTLHPQGASYTVGQTANALSVTAASPDGGTLTYQWYANDEANNASGGSPIPGANAASYTPPTATVGAVTYRVSVTNTNPAAIYSTTAHATSDTARIVVTAAGLVNAQAPAITTQPQDYAGNIGTPATALSVIATSPDGGTLSYQWFRHTANSNAGGNTIAGATQPTYTPPTGSAGTAYYYVVVTNTRNSATGEKTASTLSHPAAVNVQPAAAALPLITSHPQNATLTRNEKAILWTEALTTDGGTLSYQWHRNTTNNNSSGTPIAGANTSTYAPPTTTTGVLYYYVTVTNTNNNATGTKTASTTSNTATLTVNALVNATVPTIIAHPQSNAYNVNTTATALSVLTSRTSSDELSYQWYSNTVNSNTGGTPVGSNSETYTPPTSAAGTTYYYVAVTNTNAAATGEATATTKSHTATITVNALVNAAKSDILTQPRDTIYNVGATAIDLYVAVEGSKDGGENSYQWYRNTINSNAGGSPVGGNSMSYTPPVIASGTTWYYVDITNTNEALTGLKTATTRSLPASIRVTSNAAYPIIDAHPPQEATYNAGEAAADLSVIAHSPDGGTLSYQWYRHAENTNIGGTLISGATQATYTPPTAAAGTTYYYVAVSNTNEAFADVQTQTILSYTATVTVNALVNASAPTFDTHPQDAVYNVGEAAMPLSVSASVAGGGALSYQWYSNTTNTNAGGTPISGATQTTYTPPTAAAGTTYYYAAVTHTNNNVTGVKTAAATSLTATVRVNALVDADAPLITAHPHDTVYTVGVTAEALTVEASAADGGTLTYQWYSATASGATDGTPIPGETFAGYIPPTTETDTTYYYVIITNTNAAATGAQTATATSDTARVEVKVPDGVEALAAHALRVYPNPITDGRLYVETDALKPGEKIALYNVTGTLAGTYEVTGRITLIDVSLLPRGIYIVKAGSRATKVIYSGI